MAELNAFEKIVLVRELHGITHTQKLILLILATHIGGHDSYCISLTTFQKECCISSRHNVTDNLQILKDMKIIKVVTPYKHDKSFRYAIDFAYLARYRKGTSTAKELVPERNQTGTAEEPDWCRKGTSASTGKELISNINNINKKNNSDLANIELKKIRDKLGLKLLVGPRNIIPDG